MMMIMTMMATIQLHNNNAILNKNNNNNIILNQFKTHFYLHAFR